MRTLLEKGMVDTMQNREASELQQKGPLSLYIRRYHKFDEHTLPALFVLYLDENQPSFLFPTVTWTPSPGPNAH